MSDKFWAELGPMCFWQFVVPFCPFLFPVRGFYTAVAGAEHPVLTILFANLVSSASVTLQYGLFRLTGVDRWWLHLDRWPNVRERVNRAQQRMFRLQLFLNLMPVFDFVMPLVAAAAKYPVGKFILVTLLGRLPRIVPTVLFGAAFQRFLQNTSMAQVIWNHMWLYAGDAVFFSLVITTIVLIRRTRMIPLPSD